ncbi:hypothetical protein V9K67_15805 [Paraflavisolibacter sp. H34]|uniref:hypothetical protein n=1 Tax=Huijunlia imazamoxiresistens TaxID=3127457 RepID=UPI00301AEA43
MKRVPPNSSPSCIRQGLSFPAALLAGCLLLGGSAPGEPLSPAPVHQFSHGLEFCLLGLWMHSHEEDSPGVTVYRPEGFDFPVARGRTGYEFRKKGKLVYIGIAPWDGPEKHSGSWTIVGPDRVRINIYHDQEKPFVLKVLLCDQQVLKVRKE